MKTAIQAVRRLPLPTVPPEIAQKLRRPGGITPTPFEEKNDILQSETLQREIGYTPLPGGDWLVAMTCPMPDVTPEMLDWWFWWHAQKSERYRVWFPGEHFAVSHAKKDAAYFSADAVPPFRANTHFPVEKIGKLALPLRIDFVTPSAFGFSQKAMAKHGVSRIVCGHVGATYGLVRHTEMAHILRQTPDGNVLISRFWIGKTLKNPYLRKAILTAQTAQGMAEHCCLEYRRLAQILPLLYEAYAQ